MNLGEVTKNLPIFALAAVAVSLISCAQDEELKNLVQFQKIEPINTVTVKIDNYCALREFNGSGALIREFTLKDIYVRNLSTVVDYGKIWIDIDRDGLNPIIDNNEEYGLDIDSRDTNGDGYGDLTMLRAGIIASEQMVLAARPCDQPDQDTDNDLISDCDENLLALDKFNPDTDGDFIPDGLELRSGLSPRNPTDADIDSDGDGILNIVEVKQATPPLESNSGQIKEYAYKYSSQIDFAETNRRGGDGTDCAQYVDITIENIPVIQTFRPILVSTNPDVYRYGNVVVIMLAEQLQMSNDANDRMDPNDPDSLIERLEVRKCEIIVPDNRGDGYVFEGDYVVKPAGLNGTTRIPASFTFQADNGEVYCE